jgi:uncharacterized protein (UPF0276 family)
MPPAAAMPFDPDQAFCERARRLPALGVGISTEYGAGRAGVDVNRLAEDEPELVRFLEIGVDLERGLDDDARRWVASGRPVTYHFLDLNLEEREDLDAAWLADAGALAHEIGAAWMCGDAGLWHVGPRERGHGTLLPPVLTASSADELADNVRALRASIGLEVLPENPPAHAWLGDLHLCDYLARVAERADCGLLLDVAHLAIYQDATGRAPLDGLDGLPLERVVELHVAGAAPFVHEGRTFHDDDHGLTVLPGTWTLLEALVPRLPNLRAVVLECERNQRDGILPLFGEVRARLAARTAAGDA